MQAVSGLRYADFAGKIRQPETQKADLTKQGNHNARDNSSR